ncbi:MAG TPA: OmpA family protein [Cyclobacteriaceae bacterium]|nr:OmpA family protein [Cyclobacteriaceae bacterium]
MKYFLFLSFALMISVLTEGQQITNKSFVNVNSPLDEQGPVLSPDGKTLYFTIASHPQNVGGKRDKGDIWQSVLIGDEWSAPIHAGAVLNNKEYNAVGGFSSEGSQMFLLGHYNSQGDVKSQGISVSRKTGAGWSAPQNISIPYFLNKNETISGHINKTGNVFVFAGEGYTTLGVEDIYVSVKNASGNWSEPKNLGRNINTSFQEWSPWLSEDTRYLYFASNGRQGYGSFDIYYSQRLDDTWAKWSAPINMGAGVNSEGRELFYIPFPKQEIALYTSTLNSDGYGDIKMYRPPKEALDSLMKKMEELPPDTVVKLVEIVREKPITSDEKLVRVWGTITNASTDAPIAANVNFHSDSDFQVVAGADGVFSISVPSVDEYSIKVEAPGFLGSFEKLDIRTFEMKELEMNFKLQPVAIGATVNLKSVLFQQSTANLLDESYDELNMVVDFLKSNPTVEIELAGHTDNRGLSAHNVRLSRERVDKVKEYLTSKGIEGKRITGKGYGGIKPIADNDAEVTRRLNRRVEFTIIKN